MKWAAAALLALLVAPPGAAAAVDAARRAVIEGWLERQAAVETWAADVVQIRRLRSLSQPLEAAGRVWFAQPDRFRWQLGDPPRTIAVRDGDELLLAYPRLQRIERYAFGDAVDPGWRQAMALLEVGFPRSAERFFQRYEPLAVERGEGRWRFALAPRAEAAGKFVETVGLEVAVDDWRLLATELGFPDGSVLRNEFSGHRVDPELAPGLFEIETGPGWEVVEPLAGDG